jgi:hypothetical protein
VTTFSEHLAQRVHELERDLRNARTETRRLRESRELWKRRYQWAALAARKVNAAEKCARYRERQAA